MVPWNKTNWGAYPYGIASICLLIIMMVINIFLLLLERESDDYESSMRNQSIKICIDSKVSIVYVINSKEIRKFIFKYICNQSYVKL